jgi:hypothetical protein
VGVVGTASCKLQGWSLGAELPTPELGISRMYPHLVLLQPLAAVSSRGASHDQRGPSGLRAWVFLSATLVSYIFASAVKLSAE